MVTPNGEPGVQFGPEEKGGLPGGDYNMSQACQPSTSADESTIAPLALTYHSQDTSDLTPRDENGHKYVGLVNQAMTCYLNSLLQTLYMTPEFRNAIYEWEYTSSRNEQQSIPCQLQKLFLLLQTSELDSLETRDLTAAFGWSSNEAYDQHDVQELCRLMFDALEMRWKKSKHEKLIEQLYRGTMEDFVACLSCGRESIKPDVFLDLPLAVKPFGATEAFKSVEEALEAFVQPELLDGNNQYMCETCKSKQNAHKGLRITSFPYLLTIQLKRFDFDYTTFNRIKLNDRVSFPDLLDLNPFVHKSDEKKETRDENGANPNDDSRSIIPMEDGTHSFEAGKGGVGRKLDLSEAERLLQKGPYVYELFSVMVHQGNAAGGHYFAYIKNMDVGQWYCFNDTRVEIATPQEVEKSFGGMQGGWTNSNTNAYMLMYRQVKKEVNASFIRTPELPNHIVDLKKKWKEQEEERENKRKYEESLLRVRVFANGALVPNEIALSPFEISLPRENTVEALLTETSKHFTGLFKEKGFEGPSKKNVRLIQCTYGKIMKEAFISPADMKKKKLSSLLPGGHVMCPKDLYFIFDTKDARQACFTPVDNHKKYFTAQIHLVKIGAKKVEPPFFFPIAENDTITRIRELLGSYLVEKDFKDYRIVLEKGTDKFDVLDSPGLQFGSLFRQDVDSCTLYVDGGSPGEETNADRRMSVVQISLMCKIIDRHKYSIKLRIEIPSREELSDHNNSMDTDEMGETTVKNVVGCSTPTMDIIEEGVVVSTEGVSPPSMDSSIGDMEEEYTMSGESVCQNTPQMSPAVSDGEENAWENSNPQQHEELVAKITSLSNYTLMESASHPYDTDDVPSTTSSKTIVKSEEGKNGGTPIVHIVEERGNVVILDVDKRDKVRDLRGWLANRCGIDPGTFSFHVSYGENGSCYESSSKDEEPLDTWRTVHRLVMKLRPALKENEKMTKIYRFEMEEIDKEKWSLLFEIPLSPNSSVSEVKKKCQRLFRDKYQENLQIDQIHLRCMKQKRAELGDKERVNERLNVSWNDNLYVHIIPIERLEEVKGGKQAIFVRRFRPSTVELDKVDFVVVDPSLNSHGQMEMFKQALSHRFHVDPDHLEFVAPTAWSTWPNTKLRIDLHEKTTWVENPYREDQQILQVVSHHVIYFRDKSEEKMELTEEVRKLITIRDRGQQEAPSRRKERALRIQMNSFSES